MGKEETTNDNLMTALMSIKQDIGEVKAGVRANEGYTAAVSRKVDGVAAALEAHRSSGDAHGVAGERRGRSQLSSAFAGILSGLLGSLALLKIMGWKP